jgi:hypothetical protein
MRKAGGDAGFFVSAEAHRHNFGVVLAKARTTKSGVGLDYFPHSRASVASAQPSQ